MPQKSVKWESRIARDRVIYQSFFRNGASLSIPILQAFSVLVFILLLVVPYPLSIYCSHSFVYTLQLHTNTTCDPRSFIRRLLDANA